MQEKKKRKKEKNVIEIGQSARRSAIEPFLQTFMIMNLRLRLRVKIPRRRP